MGRKAPRKRLACRVMCTPNGCRCTRTFLGAPPTPRFGVGEAKEITPRAKARRKRKVIVQDGAIRTELTRDASCAGRSAAKTRVNALTPRASIFFAKSFYEEGWIAGSSPAMTAVSVPAPLGTQPTAVRNDGRRNFIVSGLLFTMNGATPTCRAAEGPYVIPMCHHPS
jgi:hypothetical protein